MRFRVPVILLCLAAFVVSSFAKVSKSSARPVDPSYSSALAAANRFLHAWQTQDHEMGLMMLTDGARQRVSPERLQEFFSPGEQAAYEIQRGKRLNAGEYAFPVVLFGTSQNSSQPRACKLVIMRMGKDEWSVQKLP